MFDIDLDDLDAGDAEQAGAELDDEAWNVRRDACKKLGDLGDASKAEPYMIKIRDLAGNDPDYEVKKAARRALADLREKGAKFPEVREVSTDVDGGAEAALQPGGAPCSSLEYSGPKMLFEIFREVLPMRAEREEMTPFELTEIWETSWGIQYAGRIKFEAPEGSPTKWLNPRDDIVPRSPFVVRLYCSVGSILLALGTALKQFGHLTAKEVELERERKRAQQAVEGARRQEADAREVERINDAALKRQMKRAQGKPQPMPFVQPRTLDQRSIAGLG